MSNNNNDKRDELIRRFYKMGNKMAEDKVKYESGLWPSYYILDDEKSIKWNREEVEKHNKEIKALYDAQCEDSAQTQSQLMRETYQYYRDEWQEKLPKFNYALFAELWDRACYEDDLYADRFNWIDYELEDLYEYLKLMNQ